MLRPYQPSDKAALEQIMLLNTPQYFFTGELEELKKYLDAKGDTYFVVELEGRVVGGGGYQFPEGDPSVGKISWYLIHPEYHRQGLGTLIVNHCLFLLQQAGPPERIEVWTSQLASDFYERFGFTTIRSEDNFWGPGHHLRLMEKVDARC